MYVCMVIYVRATAYSLDCHVGAMINRRLYRTFQSLVVHRTAAVTSTGRELSVAMSSIGYRMYLAMQLTTLCGMSYCVEQSASQCSVCVSSVCQLKWNDNQIHMRPIVRVVTRKLVLALSTAAVMCLYRAADPANDKISRIRVRQCYEHV